MPVYDEAIVGMLPQARLVPSYVGSGSASTGTINLPAGILAGDFIFITGARNPDNTKPVPGVDTITAIASGDVMNLAGTSLLHVQCGYKIAAVDGDTVASWTNCTQNCVVVFRNVDPVTPIVRHIMQAAISADVAHPGLLLREPRMIIAGCKLGATRTGVTPIRAGGFVDGKITSANNNELHVQYTAAQLLELAAETITQGASGQFITFVTTLNGKPK